MSKAEAAAPKRAEELRKEVTDALASPVGQIFSSTIFGNKIAGKNSELPQLLIDGVVEVKAPQPVFANLAEEGMLLQAYEPNKNSNEQMQEKFEQEPSYLHADEDSPADFLQKLIYVLEETAASAGDAYRAA